MQVHIYLTVITTKVFHYDLLNPDNSQVQQFFQIMVISAFDPTRKDLLSFFVFLSVCVSEMYRVSFILFFLLLHSGQELLVGLLQVADRYEFIPDLQLIWIDK